MFRMIRRWWARLRHKHEWVVIHRSLVVLSHGAAWESEEQRERFTRDMVLERCTCGAERARYWQGTWIRLDLDWVNDQIARQEIDIPARHQE